MVKIPESTIEQIKARADILDVISEVVTLTRRGANYVGLCPFHDDHKPSMSVSPAKGIYRCFSCGNAGNVITFVMEYDKITFVEALKKLAERYNIPVTWIKDDDGVRSSDFSQLYELHEYAKSFYQKQLYSEKGKKALHYLHSRGFSDEVIKEFNLGYAPSSWEDLLNQINRKVYSDKILDLSGLFIEKKNNAGFFDRFRDRVMFPIKNISGRTIAFGGRALDPEDPAKYMNSPETKIYNKSEILFGFDISKDAIRKKEYSLVVEGYTDFLRLFVYGFKNVVAGSGTALTQGHGKALQRFTRKVVLCYDGDEAGQKATVRAGFIFLKAGFDVKVIVLPEKDDPDSFLVENGYDAFFEKIVKAPDFLRYLLDTNQQKLQSPVEKSEFIEFMVKEIAEIEDNVVRDYMVKNLAESMNINEERIISQMKHFFNKKAAFAKNPESKKEKNPIPVIETAADKAEFHILELILTQRQELMDTVYHHLDTDNFQHPVARKIMEVILRRLNADNSIEAKALFDEVWSNDEKILLAKTIEDSAILEKKEPEVLKNLAIDCIETLLIHQINIQINEIRLKMKNAKQKGYDEMKLMKEHKSLQDQKKMVTEALRNPSAKI
ncbi:MAG: DNA primase [Candidatus Marinimicrobia bacterium]|nr:DNA primase [Candidatus Neomarinimicrobiota bacterium]